MHIHNIFGRKSMMQVDDSKSSTPWVIDREEEEADNAQLKDLEEDDDNRSLAEGMEEMLGDALQLAEQRTGSLVALQKVPRYKAVQLGRRVSTFRSIEDVDDGCSVRSFNSKLDSRSAKEPVFVKVPKGDPAILTQKSWEIIRGDSYSEGEELEPQPVTKVVDPVVLKTRKWDKLRTTLEKEENEKNSFAPRFAFGSGLKKKLGIFRRSGRRKSDLGEPNDTENNYVRTEASKDSARTGDSDNTHAANENGVSPSQFDQEEVGEECSLVSHGPVIGEETPLESPSHIDKRKRRRAHRHISKSHSPTSPEEAESLEVVYTANQVLPPFPTTMV
jgi:hypothetical protein